MWLGQRGRSCWRAGARTGGVRCAKARASWWANWRGRDGAVTLAKAQFPQIYSTAPYRWEPGCPQGDIDHATHAFGLVVPAGIVATAGVADLTLGGGSGYLTRKFGLTIDNVGLQIRLIGARPEVGALRGQDGQKNYPSQRPPY